MALPDSIQLYNLEIGDSTINIVGGGIEGNSMLISKTKRSVFFHVILACQWSINENDLHFNESYCGWEENFQASIKFIEWELCFTFFPF